MTLLLAFLLLAAPALAVPSSAAAQRLPAPQPAPGAALCVAVVTDRAGAGVGFTEAVQREVQAAFEGARGVTFAKPRAGDGTLKGVRRALGAALAAPGVDAVIAVGPLSLHVAAARAQATKPLVATAPAGGPFEAEASPGTEEAEAAPAPNIALVRAPRAAAADLRTLAQLVPEARRVAVVVEAQGAAEQLALPPPVIAAAGALGLTLDPVALASSARGTLAQLPDEAEVVYLTSLGGLSAEEQQALRDGLLERGLPSLVSGDPAAVEKGLLASRDQDLRADLARRVAVRLRELVETGSSAPLEAHAAGGRLVVNEAVADALGLDLPWAVRLNARLVGEAAPSGPVLTLAGAMQESILENLSLQIDRYETDAAGENVHLAQSRLLPQVGLESRGRLVSEDQAEASLGGQPERLLTGTMTFRQVLFSEPAFASLSAERRRQAARAYELDAARLSAADTAATAYTNLLRARAQERIQRENLELALANLEAARTRRRLDEAGPAEVSRLETTASQARRRVASAAGQRQAAEIALNQVLGRPLEAPAHVVGDRPEDVLERFPYAALLETPQRRQAFQAFWLEEARQQAPEIQAAGRLAAAQERQLRSAERSFFLPEVALEGSFTQRVEESGVGTGVPDVPQNLAGVIQRPPGEQWNVGLTLSFSLFRGTERVARRQQAAGRLRAVRTQQDLAARRVEQRTRTAFAQLETAYVETEQARAAAEAAARSLTVVQASYRQGTASVLDLLDAQSTVLVTQEEAVGAAYDFELQWIELQRAAGSFAGLRAAEEEAQFEARFAPVLSASAAPGLPGPRDDRDAPEPADPR